MNPMLHQACLCVIALGVTVAVVNADDPLPIGNGPIRSLSALPERIVLNGSNRLHQLVITGQFANGGIRDLTRQVKYHAIDPGIVRVSAGGMLITVKNGRTEVITEFQGKTAKVTITVERADREQPIHFVNEIAPIFSKLGCNSGACHGKSTGQNGFRLSLLGFEPQVDFEALTREARGRRIVPSLPEASLLLQKPTGQLPHGGGKRLSAESRDYHLLLRWIRAGTPFGSETDPKVVGLAIMPGQRLAPPKSKSQIAVAALYSDGSRRDVTADAEYSSNHSEIATVTEGGLIETQDLPGEGTIMVRYLGHVGVFRVAIPQDIPPEKCIFPRRACFVDDHVFAKLKHLGIPPSDLCNDSEFLRRVSLDITGTLPTAKEADAFLRDTDVNKRTKWVDELLGRPAYASYFALKWGDILRNRRDGIVGVGGKQERTQALHEWIRESMAKNKPYDRFVREILTATGDFSGPKAQPPVGWYNVLRTPQALVDDTAQVFLGTRIQCAQCHHHPYEKWSQDDYWELAAFFARVQLVNPKNVAQAKKANSKANASDIRVVLMPDGLVTGPHGKSYAKPRPLGAWELDVPASEDPREKLVDWMVHPNNPFFAKAIANRYWAHFFGRGIVDMPDDMRISNPPSNEPLLDALA